MPIHVAITRKILPGREEEFHQALRKFMGQSFAHDAVHGAGIITFPHEKQQEIGILRSFANEAEKDAFYDSELFKEWERFAAPLTEGVPEYRELTGLEAWFRAPNAPPRWKMAIVTLMGVYPVSLVLNFTIGGLIAPLPAFIKSLIFAISMVGLLTWVVMPFLVKRMKGWLHRGG